MCGARVPGPPADRALRGIPNRRGCNPACHRPTGNSLSCLACGAADRRLRPARYGEGARLTRTAFGVDVQVRVARGRGQKDSLSDGRQARRQRSISARMNRNLSFGRTRHAWTSPADYEQQLHDEVEQLYDEGGERRRMMSISLHDRISGHASRVRVVDRFLIRAVHRADEWWARRDEIADWALATPDVTLTVHRLPAEQSGLPGISASPRMLGATGIRRGGVRDEWYSASPGSRLRRP